MLNEIDSLKVFKKLREKSAEIKENLYGQTVLHLASYFNKIELVKYIIENDNSNGNHLTRILKFQFRIIEFN